MLVGVVSDLHGTLSEDVAAALEPCDFILCAGDMERPVVLMELESLAPTVAVRGNCDGYAFDNLPGMACPRLAGVRFRVVHRPEDMGKVPDDVAVAIHGHTHVPRNQVIHGTLFLNPGSSTRPRGGSKKSIAFISVDAGRVEDVEFKEFD